MQTQVKKWGNSFGLRLPMHIINDLEISDGSIFEIQQNNEQIILTKVKDKISLAELIHGMTKEGLKEQHDDYKYIGLEEDI
jgi:antitoxin MazE